MTFEKSHVLSTGFYWLTIAVILFWGFVMFDQIFLSPQKKRSVIISSKHGLYELTHELPNDLRLRILRNEEISEKSTNFIKYSLVIIFSLKMEVLSILVKTLLKNRNWTFLVVSYFTVKLELDSNILWMIVSGNHFLLLTSLRVFQSWFVGQFS